MHCNLPHRAILSPHITGRLLEARMVRFDTEAVVELSCVGGYFVFGEGRVVCACCGGFGI